jgi:hypothetical protein
MKAATSRDSLFPTVIAIAAAVSPVLEFPLPARLPPDDPHEIVAATAAAHSITFRRELTIGFLSKSVVYNTSDGCPGIGNVNFCQSPAGFRPCAVHSNWDNTQAQ